MAAKTTTRRKKSSTAKDSKTKDSKAVSKKRKSRIPKRSRSSDDEGSKKTHDIWRGVISFGLVEIPVALVSTEKPGGISLSLLDKRDMSPVGYRRYNKVTGDEVPWAEITHGYEYEKSKYVVVGKKDVAKADPELAGTIVIDRFVDFTDVAPIQFDRPYYLEPLNARSKGYALLRTALENTGKAGVARMVLRTRQYVALVAVHGPSLVLYLLRFGSEVRKPSALDNMDGNVRITAAETQMAEKLVEDMAGEWRPQDYSDEYTDALLKVIERRVKSGDVHEVEKDEKEPAHKREVVDLMPLLERSLGAKSRATKRGSQRTPARSRAATGRRRTKRRTARTRSA